MGVSEGWCILILSPSDLSGLPRRKVGGDSSVPRDSKDRPRIIVTCDKCKGLGIVESEKVPGRMNKCQKCHGEGRYLRSYTRTTSFIDVLEDKRNIQAWAERNVLIGVARDLKFVNGVEDLSMALESGNEEERRAAKNSLNRKAEVAKDKAGANRKSEQGTYLHGLSELVDQGKPLPPGVTPEDRRDLAAYRAAKHESGLEHVYMERLMVNDELRVGGTPDRIDRPSRTLIAPDGTVITDADLIITDLKTGTVEFGALKMAMQLSIYANSELYDPANGERTPVSGLRTDWGIIVNAPAGTGECALYWADLRLGWEAVQVAAEVRRMRKAGRMALIPLKSNV